MTSGDSLEAAVLSSERFQRILEKLTRQSVATDLLSGRAAEGLTQSDWSFALLCASGLTGSRQSTGQEAALRVAQSCISSNAEAPYRDAAAIILERLGNRQSIKLAMRRGYVQDGEWLAEAGPLQQDVIRRRIELTIPTGDEGSVEGNLFQRQFWTAARESDWLSISAPTSAGKSYIVKRWIEDRSRLFDTFRAVYVVPTRALIEEVSLDLTLDLGRSVRVHTMPWDSEIGEADKEVFVVTQERFHLLQQRFQQFAPDLVFIDEAQKFDDGPRGVLLQQVLDETVRRSPRAQVIFASPFTSNPEVLLKGAPAGNSVTALVSEGVTVNQNLIFANQVPRKPQTWTLGLAIGEEVSHVGSFDLAARPSPKSKRLPLVAVALGGRRSGNVVYVNGAADGEKAARQIYEALGRDAVIVGDADIDSLRELSRTAVHRQYALEELLQRGVAFHYGNMPLLLKSEVERLFKEEKIRYLVCTSTLLEGVNLPCRNLFVRGPRKGRGNVMSPADFWNLAGRAGRWGKEFQGNIVCVDTNDVQQWPIPPHARVRQRIERASARVLSRLDDLLAYIEAGTPVAASREAPLFEPVFSLLASRFVQGRDLASIVGLEMSNTEAQVVESTIGSVMAQVSVPNDIVARHAGISPLSMQRLLNAFVEVDDLPALVLPPPESIDAVEVYRKAIAMVDRELGGDWGTEGRQYQLAILITEWMRGRPLAALISNRMAYARLHGTDIPRAIRDTMADVEQIARFQAPKFLSCYQDLLRVRADELGLEVLKSSDFDVSMMLELGVSRTTEVSLMALGLSRTTAISLSELIVDDDLSPQEALEWLLVQNVDSLALPVLVRREIRIRLSAEDPAV